MKAYTNLEQSKKLAEIMPLESADMRFCFSHTLGGRITGHYPMIGREPSLGTIPCWSLAALLGLMPSVITRRGKRMFLTLEKAGAYNLYYKSPDRLDELWETKENTVDACYEMVLKLHELNLL